MPTPVLHPSLVSRLRAPFGNVPWAVSENFEGGNSGDAVTTSNTIFQSILGTPTLDSSVRVDGALSMRFNPGSAVDTYAQLKAAPGALGSAYVRFFVHCNNGFPNTATVTPVAIWRGNFGLNVRAGVALDSSGHVILQNTGSATVYTSTGTIPSAAWVRIEWRVDGTAGAQQVQVFSGANLFGTTPDFDSGNQTFTTNPIDTFRVGQVLGSGLTAAWDVSVDAFALRSDTWVGSPNTLVVPTLTDTGSGADTLSVAAAVALSDNGSAADALTVAAAVPLSDTGAFSDSLAVAASVPLADTGAFTESLTVTAAVALTDVGAFNDAVSVAAAVALADAGSFTDSLSVAAAVALADTGAAVDALAVAARIPLTDFGALADVLSVAVAVPLTDTGQAVDALAVAAAVSLTDAATSTDNLAVSGGSNVSLFETGTTTDTLTVTAALALSDIGSAADLLAVAGTLALADTGTSTDALAVAGTLALADAGGFAEAFTVTSGTLNAGPDQTYTVGRELRTVTVGAEARVLAVPRETRSVSVTAEQRTERIPAEDRTVRR